MITLVQSYARAMVVRLKTCHREVATNQYEMADYFGHVTSQIDEKVMV